MNRYLTPFALIAATAVLGTSACLLDDLEAPNGPNGGGGPRAGELIVNLNTPASDDGAVLLEVTGPSLTSPTAGATGFSVFSTQPSADMLTVIVVGDLQNGPIFSIPVTDVDRVGEYSVTVRDVAARDDALRGNLSGYGASLVAAPN